MGKRCKDNKYTQYNISLLDALNVELNLKDVGPLEHSANMFRRVVEIQDSKDPSTGGFDYLKDEPLVLESRVFRLEDAQENVADENLGFVKVHRSNIPTFD